MVAGKGLRAHRVSYELFNGPIVDGMQVCHRCDTPTCANPDHLFLGTGRDNAVDCINKGRNRPPKGECHPNARLNAAQVSAIREESRAGVGCTTLARKYGTSVSNAYQIARGLAWKTPGYVGKSKRHPEGNPFIRSRLSPETIAELRADHAAGMSVSKLARKFGLSMTTAWRAAKPAVSVGD